MKSLGADDNFLMLCASPHNPAVMPSSNRKIEQGDILLTELTPSYEGQFVQICRTVAIGPPRAELQQKYDLVLHAMWAGIEAVHGQARLGDIGAAIMAVAAREGCSVVRDYGGHGIGRSMHTEVVWA